MPRVPGQPFEAFVRRQREEAQLPGGPDLSLSKDPEYFEKLKEAESKNLFVPGDLDDVVLRAV